MSAAHTPGHIFDKVDDLVDTLSDCAAGPMWPDHAEISKATLVYAVEVIRELSALAKATGSAA